MIGASPIFFRVINIFYLEENKPNIHLIERMLNMLNFIKVEDYDDGEEIRINAEHIVKYTSYNWGATIQFVNGKSLEVRNTIEEIDEMIENINKKWEK